MSLGIFQLSLVNVCSVYIFHCCRCMELETFKKKNAITHNFFYSVFDSKIYTLC